MGLFDKKYCDICGEKIGFLGNRKLEDGNLCKDCAKKLSPLFRERRSSTVEEIRAQLKYREENERRLADFNPDFVYGDDEKIYLDYSGKRFVVTSSDDFREGNPDIIEVSQITSWKTKIEDNKEELFYTDEEGNEKSYDPPRYRNCYEFYVTFNIDSPWFDEIVVDLNNGNRPDDILSDDYNKYSKQMEDLVRKLNDCKGGNPYQNYLGIIDGGVRPNAVASSEDIGEWTCSCGSVNKRKYCEECGSPRV